MKIDIKLKHIIIDDNSSLTLEELITFLRDSGLKDFYNYKIVTSNLKRLYPYFSGGSSTSTIGTSYHTLTNE